MADVFISYKREDRAAVEKIAGSLRKMGLAVWFDVSLTAGETFNIEIDREARKANSVLVCWSPSAMKSKWVNAEALIGFEANKLVACYVAGDGSIVPPMPFNTSHAEDLVDWLKEPEIEQSTWRNLVRRIGKLCGREDIETWGAFTRDTTAHVLCEWIATHQNSPLLLSTDALLRDRERRDAVLLEQETQVRQQRSQEAEAQRVKQEKQKIAQERERRLKYGWGATLRGSLIAIPIFLVGYVLVATIAYFGLILVQFLDIRQGGIDRGAELLAAVVSSYFGVLSGRLLVDSTLRTWNGWPSFLSLVATWSAASFLVLSRPELTLDWWTLFSYGLQGVASIIVGFLYLVLKISTS